MMGLRGVSILEASGDGGKSPEEPTSNLLATSRSANISNLQGVGAPCRANDGSDRVEFTPQFPASCPYITAVGGTQGFDPEVAWGGSGSGFSNYFGRAWYQKDAIEKYLDEVMDWDLKKEYEQYANYTGRGFPDISGHSSSP